MRTTIHLRIFRAILLALSISVLAAPAAQARVDTSSNQYQGGVVGVGGPRLKSSGTTAVLPTISGGPRLKSSGTTAVLPGSEPQVSPVAGKGGVVFAAEQPAGSGVSISIQWLAFFVGAAIAGLVMALAVGGMTTMRRRGQLAH